jgi:ribose transport system permease protein
MEIKERLRDRIFSLGASIILLSIIMAFVFPNRFPTIENFSQIMLNLSIDTIVAVGMMVLMIGGMFDLSVGSIVAFAGGMAGYLMYYHNVNFIMAIIAALTGSVIIGFINGWLIAKIGINPMIQTLAMMGVVRGFALMLSGAGIQNFPYNFIYFGQSKLLGLQAPVWYMLAIVFVFGFLVNNTVFFRRYYFIGGNEKAARLSGINVKKMKILGFVISALLAGIAGLLLSSRLGAALSTSGEGLELRVITAVILGGASLSGGVGKIWGAFLGVLFMALINNLLIISRVSGYWQQVILGAILIIAVGIDQLLLKKLDK